MEQDTARAIGEKAKTLGENEATKKFAAQIDRHLLTGEPEYFSLGYQDDEALKLLCELLDLNKFDGSKVIAYKYSHLFGETFEQSTTEPGFTGIWSVIKLQERLGDIGTNFDFPNNFAVQLIIELDVETALIIDHTSDSQPRVCDECARLEEYDDFDGWNRLYSCDHCDDELFVRNSAVLRKMPTKEQLEKLFAHGEIVD